MNPADALATHRMARAHTALEEAAALLERRHFGGTLNRLYYAAFYAARALLATCDLDSSRHSGVISLFQERFVRTGVIGSEIARVLPRTFEKRQTSDYDDFSEPTEDEVRSLRDQVQVFVAACQDVLNSAG